MLVDPCAIIVFATSTAGALLGYEVEELCGQSFRSVLADPEREEALLATGGNARVRAKSGKLLGVSIRVSSLVSAEPGRAMTLLVFSSDVNEKTGVTGEFGGRAGDRIDLLHRIMGSLGNSLEVEQMCDALVSALVPDFADWAAVDLAQAVFSGDPLPTLEGPWPSHGRMGAVRTARGLRVDLRARDRAISRTPEFWRSRQVRMNRAFLTPDLTALTRGATEEAEFLRTVLPKEARSEIVAPLFTNDGLMGVLSVARRAGAQPFDEEDLKLVQEILPKASLNLNNAWRYAREYRTAVSLQRSLLPRTFATITSAEIGGTYVAAGAGRGVSGDWYDVIPLSSFRTAFVVGDVVGHGLGATALMGRLRTAVQSFADLDLDPQELLSRLDDLVGRMSAERESVGGRADDGVTGTTCLYAVYDPVSRHCLMASAGHPAPAVVRPDGTVQFIDLDPGPPLGVCSAPFEMTDVELAAGSVLALYTDGLLREHEQGSEGVNVLRRQLAQVVSVAGVGLQEASRDIVAAMLPTIPEDDAALLLARTRELPATDMVHRDLAADESVVAEARNLVVGQLAAWGLEDLAFTAEIVASELVTNAIRHADGPIAMRLLHDGIVICEVTDASNTQPRMRRARSTEENGRGLYIVAQLARRWGCRYGRRGKTIWAELT
ncbi:SpoIIE family protein phosphatase [Streptomyces sp. NPDC002514]|uniref:ATP-binding SpoIIE family protein phosphatase n=2 Tax=unclassified Streptomyces TaxID=2593676 RepID=UPI0036B0DD57